MSQVFWAHPTNQGGGGGDPTNQKKSYTFAP